MNDRHLLLLILAVIVTMFSLIFGAVSYSPTEETIKVTVAVKVYAPASSGVGTGFSSNGRGSVVPVVTSSPEKWILLVEGLSEDLEKVECNKKMWARAVEGKPVELRVWKNWYGAKRILGK